MIINHYMQNDGEKQSCWLSQINNNNYIINDDDGNNSISNANHEDNNNHIGDNNKLW